MTKKNNLVKHKFPTNLSSVEQNLIVASLLEDLNGLKTLKHFSIYGIDLLTRKICPNTEMFNSTLSEIFNINFTVSELVGSEFIIPNTLIKELKSDIFKQECLQQQDEILSLWTTISAYETIEYINQLLYKINSKEVDLDNAKPIIERLTENFSTGQLWNLSYKANQRACEIILTQKIDEKDYPDILLHAILEKGLLYINKGWKILPFKRWGNQCKQSELSQYFFNEVLQLGEDGFNTIPSIENLKQVQ